MKKAQFRFGDRMMNVVRAFALTLFCFWSLSPLAGETVADMRSDSTVSGMTPSDPSEFSMGPEQRPDGEKTVATAVTEEKNTGVETIRKAISRAGDGAKQFPLTPTLKEGKRWRVAYYEGGPYDGYKTVLLATIRGLMKLGWIESKEYAEATGDDTASVWAWLGKNVKSDYIEFVQDAHYSVGWDDEKRNKGRVAVLRRLSDVKDVDLIIAMGTWAGKDLANGEHSTPTIVLSTSDPISSGIIKSVEDSGHPHVHARVDPGRYERQIRAFHEIINFKRLGVAYEDSVAGRSYAALSDIERVAKEKGFSVVPCHTQSDISDIKKAEESVISCFSRLAREVDALYITLQGGVTSQSIPKLVALANEHSVPTFSQRGTVDVKAGVLASLSKAGYRYIGDFHAKTMAKVFNGAKPNELAQLFEEPPKMAINLKTAELIGFNPPVILIGATDEIFDEIETPK